MYDIQGIQTFTMDEYGNYTEVLPEVTEYVGRIQTIEHVLDRFYYAKYCFPTKESEEILAKQYYQVIKQLMEIE